VLYPKHLAAASSQRTGAAALSETLVPKGGNQVLPADLYPGRKTIPLDMAISANKNL
jgi:hypothetical protein